MNANRTFIIMAGILMLSVSCAGPKLSNLHKGTYDYRTAPGNILEVSVSILPIPKAQTEPEKPKTFFDLKDSLPHTFLKVMAAKTTDPEKLISLLSKPLSSIDPTPPTAEKTNYTELKIRFAFSNIKKYFHDEHFMHPNTRLEFLNTSLIIPEGSPFTFYNIDKLENEFEEIDLGNLERSKDISFNAKLSGEGALGTGSNQTTSSKNSISNNNKNKGTKNLYDKAGNIVATQEKNGEIILLDESSDTQIKTADAKANIKADLSYLNSESIKEAVAVKLKRLKTGFSIQDKKLVIAQRGRPGGDISDNIYITATLRFNDPKKVNSMNVFSFSNLFSAQNHRNPADELLFKMRNVTYVSAVKIADMNFSTSYEGAIRAVRNNDLSTGKNALEYDDRVAYYRLKDTAGNPLKIDKNLITKEVYKITAINSQKDTCNLMIDCPEDYELDLFSEDQPERFLKWLTLNMENPSSKVLSTKKFRLYFLNPRTQEQINVVSGSFTADDIKKLKQLTHIEFKQR